MPSCLSAWASSDIDLRRSIFFFLDYYYYFPPPSISRLATLPDSFYYILISSIRPFRQIDDDLSFAKKSFWCFYFQNFLLFALDYWLGWLAFDIDGMDFHNGAFYGIFLIPDRIRLTDLAVQSCLLLIIDLFEDVLQDTFLSGVLLLLLLLVQE